VQKITPFLWFDDQAEEAMNFYVSVFKNSKVGRVTRYGEGGPGPKGTVMSATFQLDGQEFFALNGARTSPSRPRYRSSSTVRRRKKSTSYGKSFRRAGKKKDAAG
jgi:predicted 3-demethylubiquinone-9 3-methyltransferase (glyoxalase superfamily)